jgi:hypothetical protein
MEQFKADLTDRWISASLLEVTVSAVRDNAVTKPA